MRVAGICGSDLNYLALGTNKILGHELAGVRADGTPVAIEGLFGCGECEYCRTGRNNLCHRASQMALGYMQDGGMAEKFRVPPEKLGKLPAVLDMADASLVEPASVAWHGVRMGGTSPETTVAVIGGGSIGQLAAVAAQAQRAGDVALEARHPHQHEIRERFGVGEPRERYDVVIEAAGSASSIQRSVELVKPGGTVVVLGVCTAPLTFHCQPSSSRRSGWSPPWAIAGTQGSERWSTLPRCLPHDRRLGRRSSRTAFLSRMRPRHFALPPTADRAR
jgi:threonine dehydrogenase-like Zn-dependent dehydrogenase